MRKRIIRLTFISPQLAVPSSSFLLLFALPFNLTNYISKNFILILIIFFEFTFFCGNKSNKLNSVFLMFKSDCDAGLPGTFVEATYSSQNNRHDIQKNELKTWSEHRYIQCNFCMDYDDYEHFSIFGCVVKNPPKCYGNVCYMRQHKEDNNFFLYTTGCLNLTQKNYNKIKKKVSVLRPARDRNGIETQLCEVTLSINTCICTNRVFCNNISSLEPASEYTEFIFKDIDFDEVAHFRHFLPNYLILKNSSIIHNHKKHHKNKNYAFGISKSSASVCLRSYWKNDRKIMLSFFSSLLQFSTVIFCAVIFLNVVKFSLFFLLFLQ